MSGKFTDAEIAQQDTHYMGNDIVTTLSSAKDLTALSFPVMLEKSRLASMALSNITAITNDEQKEAALKNLGRVKSTFELINKMRMDITAPLDALKSKLMEPEKKISILAADKDSEYNRVKRIVDKYIQDQIDRQKEENRKLLMKQRHDQELIRLSAMMENRFTDNITNAALQMSSSIQKFLETITAANYEEQVAKLNVKPNLKRDTFDSWFTIDASTYDTEAVPAEAFMTWIGQVKEKFNYEEINALYLKKAEPILNDAKKLLPALKKELDRIATLSANEQAEAEEKLKQQQQDDAKKKEDELKQAADLEKEKADNEAGAQKLELSFNTHIAIQENEVNTKGTRKNMVATIVAPNTEVVKVLSQMMFAIFTAPKFDGIIKKDKKSGENKKDENDRPVYIDFVEDILSLFAKHCPDVAIPGIEMKEIVKSTVKA